MFAGQMFPGQVSRWKLLPIKASPLNLLLGFGPILNNIAAEVPGSEFLQSVQKHLKPPIMRKRRTNLILCVNAEQAS